MNEPRTDRRTRLIFGVLMILVTIVLCQGIVLLWLWVKHAGTVETSQSNGSFVFEISRDRNLVRDTFPAVDFTQVYPDLSRREIDQLQRESFGLRYVYAPFVQFEPLPVAKRFVTVSKPGFRNGRSKQPWPPKEEDFVVFVFGGSTTFGYGLHDSRTLPAALEQEIGKAFPDRNVQCYNFGRGYYFSTQELILFTTLLQRKTVPNVAIFVDGLNDYYYFDGNPELTRTLWAYTARDLPAPQMRRLSSEEEKASAVRALLDRMASNFRMAKAIADSYKVKAIFVGQPVPFWRYPVRPETYPFRRPFSGHDLCKWGYGKFEEAAMAGEFGDSFIWCGDSFSHAKTTMYADSIHYSRTGAAMLARTIVNRLFERGILQK